MKTKPKQKKLDQSKLNFLPVPEGMKMFYKHIYHPIGNNGPKMLVGTTAVLKQRVQTWDMWVELARAEVHVHPNDTPFKKLGRCIAHNRAIKAYQRSLANATG